MYFYVKSGFDRKMSDEEEVQYVKRQKTIHYGSLEATERAKMVKNEGGTNGESIADIVKETPQIHTSNEYFDIEDEV